MHTSGDRRRCRTQGRLRRWRRRRGVRVLVRVAVPRAERERHDRREEHRAEHRLALRANSAVFNEREASSFLSAG